MADYITGIRTSSGDKKIGFEALVGAPGSVVWEEKEISEIFTITPEGNENKVDGVMSGDNVKYSDCKILGLVDGNAYSVKVEKVVNGEHVISHTFNLTASDGADYGTASDAPLQITSSTFALSGISGINGLEIYDRTAESIENGADDLGYSQCCVELPDSNFDYIKVTVSGVVNYPNIAYLPAMYLKEGSIGYDKLSEEAKEKVTEDAKNYVDEKIADVGGTDPTDSIIVLSHNKFNGEFTENTIIDPTTEKVSTRNGKKCTPEYIVLSEELSKTIYVAISKAPIDRVYVMIYDENKNRLGQINILSSVGGATVTSRTYDTEKIKYFRLYTDMDYDGQIYISPKFPGSADNVNYEYKSATERGLLLENTNEILLSNHIPGTTQNIIYNTNGTVKQVEHKNDAGNIIRTDTYTYTDTTLKEVRTLSNGASRTFILYYDSLKMEVK